MKAYEAVARFLLDSGVNPLFGLMGDGNMRYLASYLEAAEGRYIGAAHENGAVAMAEGYAKMTGRLGVISITHGPGVANAMTAITEAARSRTPLVVLTGDTPRRREHRQWLDLRAAAHLAGAAYRGAQSAESMVEDLAVAMRLAMSVKRPVLMDLPVDMLDEPIEYTPPAFSVEVPPNQVIRPDEDLVDDAAGIVATAGRPVLLVGRGAVVAGAHDEIVALSELLQAPIATTVGAMNEFAGHPRYLGIFGTEAFPYAAEFITQADCVVAFGAGLNEFTTANGELLAGKAVIQCDTDTHILASRYPATLQILGDAKAFAEELRTRLEQLGPRERFEWSTKIERDIAAYQPLSDFVDGSNDETVDMRVAVLALSEVLPADRAYVTGIGRYKTAPWRYFSAPAGGFAQTGGFATVGLDLAMAIGVSVARPDATTVAFVGDGGLVMSLAELTTVARLRSRLLIVVLNDGSYGAEFKKLVDLGHDPRHSLQEYPSFVDLVRGFGIDGATVRSADDIRALRPRLAEQEGPFLIDVKADPEIDILQYR